MRRALLSALGIAALALGAPGIASAHHRHHKVRSKAHHVRVRFEHFGAPLVGPPTGPSSTDRPTNTPSQPTSTNETAGKVASFTEGMLTITLNDGSTVSGRVTSNTEIECMKAPTAAPQTTASEDTNSNEDSGEGDKPSGDSSEGDKQDDDSAEGGKEDDGEDGGVAASSSEPPCDASALTTGTVVKGAELRISSGGGAEFESIELVR